jgi:hypothetical protein
MAFFRSGVSTYLFPFELAYSLFFVVVVCE